MKRGAIGGRSWSARVREGVRERHGRRGLSPREAEGAGKSGRRAHPRQLEAAADAAALLALLLGLGASAAAAGAAAQGHRRWVLYSFLKRETLLLLYEACATYGVRDAEGSALGRTRVFRSAEKFFDRSGLRGRKNIALMRIFRPRSKSSFARNPRSKGARSETGHRSNSDATVTAREETTTTRFGAHICAGGNSAECWRRDAVAAERRRSPLAALA